MDNFKELGKYESKEGNVRVLLDEENKMLCDVSMDELSKIVGYSTKESLKQLMDRNPRLRTTKFSRIELMQTAGGIQETRLFTERGILEVAFLASTEKAEQFRDEISDLLVSLREKNMISFGANGLDVKLLEQVKESNDRAASIGEEATKEVENLGEAIKKMNILFEAVENLAEKIEQFEKDKEAIESVKFFEERLVESELDIVIIQKDFKKICETLEKIEKSQKAMDTKLKKIMGGKE